MAPKCRTRARGRGARSRTPPRTWDLAQPLDEGLMCAALDIGGLADEFLAEWRAQDPGGQQRYQHLCSESGNSERFLGNPLAFILANRPACCLARAVAFVEVMKEIETARENPRRR